MADRKHGVFTAGAVKQESLGDAPADGANRREAVEVEVLSVVGTSPIYCTAAADGGTPPDPATRGDDTHVCQPGAPVRIPVRGAPPVTVKMRCATADTYAVEVFTE